MREAIKQFIQNFKKDERGLTLVELLAVVVILAIVGLIAFVAIGNVIENSKKDAHVANAQQVISAAELYEASGGEIDANQSAIGLDTLEDELIDPWTKTTSTNYDFTLSKTEQGVIEIASDHKECNFASVPKAKLAEDGRGICDPKTEGSGN